MSASAMIIIDINVHKVNISACGVFYTNIGDCDPFAYFAELEGVGSTESDLDTDFYDEESIRDFEKRMENKYGKSDNDQ